MRQKALNRMLQKPRRVALGLYLRQYHGEMVGTYPRQQVGIAGDAGHPLRHLFQKRVAGRLAEAVVDVLESLQIEQEHRQHVLSADGAANVLPQALQKQALIRQTGQHIVVGEVIKPRLLVEMVDRERDVAGQLRQQLHLRVIEIAGFRRVQAEYGNGFISDQQGQQRQ
ncbi:MAG: hypothetical protein OZX49_02200 [Immundisolibacter sp.]|nr:hypothetical protein [Immundisolibacter sp.]